MKIGEQVQLVRLDIVPPDSTVFAGSAKKIMSFVPFSHYSNNAFATDESNEQKAYLLSKTGIVIKEVRGGYCSSHSDGTMSQGRGEQVKEALRRLSKSEYTRTYFVIVVTRQEAQDNTFVTSKSTHHECRGLKTRNNVTAKLYTIK